MGISSKNLPETHSVLHERRLLLDLGHLHRASDKVREVDDGIGDFGSSGTNASWKPNPSCGQCPANHHRRPAGMMRRRAGKATWLDVGCLNSPYRPYARMNTLSH